MTILYFPVQRGHLPSLHCNGSNHLRRHRPLLPRRGDTQTMIYLRFSPIPMLPMQVKRTHLQKQSQNVPTWATNIVIIYIWTAKFSQLKSA